MPDPNQCRKHAQECSRLAMSSRSTDACKRFEELARTWMRLAVEIERAHALKDELTLEEARRIALNVRTLPNLLKR